MKSCYYTIYFGTEEKRGRIVCYEDIDIDFQKRGEVLTGPIGTDNWAQAGQLCHFVALGYERAGLPIPDLFVVLRQVGDIKYFRYDHTRIEFHAVESERVGGPEIMSHE